MATTDWTAADAETVEKLAARLLDLRAQALVAITRAVAQLDRVLYRAQLDILAARDSIKQGLAVEGVALGFGPVGHQAPFDIAQASERLRAATEYAYQLGCSTEEVQAAYKATARY